MEYGAKHWGRKKKEGKRVIRTLNVLSWAVETDGEENKRWRVFRKRIERPKHAES